MLKDIPAAARPREKLLALGPAALADAELVALLLRTGLAGTGVLQLAQNLLDAFGGLAGLLRAGPDELKRVRGLGGTAKRAEVAAVLELARRAVAGELMARPVFDTPGKVKDYLALQLGGRPHEVFAVLFLDAQSRLIALEEMFRGTLTQTSVYPREVLKRALDLHAAAVILAHNHPSGAAEPSRADEYLTQTLKSALALVDGACARSPRRRPRHGRLVRRTRAALSQGFSMRIVWHTSSTVRAKSFRKPLPIRTDQPTSSRPVPLAANVTVGWSIEMLPTSTLSIWPVRFWARPLKPVDWLTVPRASSAASPNIETALGAI